MSIPAVPERLAAIPETQWTAAQREAAAALTAGPRGSLRGPFIALLRSPELLDRTQRLGEYLRYRSVLPPKLRELAILATARHWSQRYEWHAHTVEALQAGWSKAQLLALGQQREPPGIAPDEATVLQFCLQLHRSCAVSDELYERTRLLLGEQGVVELCGICGYYSLLAMVLNVARIPPPPDAAIPFAAPDNRPPAP